MDIKKWKKNNKNTDMKNDTDQAEFRIRFPVQSAILFGACDHTESLEVCVLNNNSNGNSDSDSYSYSDSDSYSYSDSDRNSNSDSD
eukprot:Pgem_evm1s4881